MLTDLPNQHQHLIRINTVLGTESIVVNHLSGRETLSEGFFYTVEISCDGFDPEQIQKLLGSKVTLTIEHQEQPTRWISGIINSISELGWRRAGAIQGLSISIVSWLSYALAQRCNCRLFQELNAQSLFDSLFEPYGNLAQWQYRAKPTPHRSFTAQYNESDHNLFNRVCAEEGLAYYFVHHDHGHVLHIIDADTPLEHYPNALKHQSQTVSHAHLSHWQKYITQVPLNYAQSSYHYARPNQILHASAQPRQTVTATEHAQALPGIFRYTERLSNPKDASHYTQSFANANPQIDQYWQGSCNYSDLTLGQRFQVKSTDGLPHPDQHRHLTACELSIEASNEPSSFHLSFRAISEGILVLPSFTPTRIPGLQTATVQGPVGEEIYTDFMGRIKVHFHWDHGQTPSEHSSCWLRVMQSAAGKGFGSHFIPRVGHEVVVAFENGHPDRPFVLGSLYHAEHLPPYAEQKGSRSGIRTRSTKLAKPQEGNELFFEDRRGFESINLKAQKDLHLHVNNDEHHAVQGHRTDHTIKSATQKVGTHLQCEAGEKITLEVGSSRIEISHSGIKISGASVEIHGDIKLN